MAEPQQPEPKKGPSMEDRARMALFKELLGAAAFDAFVAWYELEFGMGPVTRLDAVKDSELEKSTTLAVWKELRKLKQRVGVYVASVDAAITEHEKKTPTEPRIGL